VRKLLTSGNGYDIVIGQAGTGKSTMLKTARAGWEAVGLKVIGAAVAVPDGGPTSKLAPASPAHPSASS